ALGLKVAFAQVADEALLLKAIHERGKTFVTKKVDEATVIGAKKSGSWAAVLRSGVVAWVVGDQDRNPPRDFAESIAKLPSSSSLSDSSHFAACVKELGFGRDGGLFLSPGDLAANDRRKSLAPILPSIAVGFELGTREVRMKAFVEHVEGLLDAPAAL